MTVEELYRKYFDSEVKLISRYVGRDTAEDIVQDAFINVLKYYNKSRPKNVEAWLRRIIFNCLSKHFKENRTIEEDPLKPISDERKVDILEHIESVSNPKHKEVLKLFYILGYTSKEIENLKEGMSGNNVRQITKRFRDDL